MGNYQQRKIAEPMENLAQGGGGLFTRVASEKTYAEYGFDFRLVVPEMGYIRHGFPVQDPTVMDAYDDGTARKWVNVYCLASPRDQRVEVIEPDPTRIEECNSIIIPGTQIGLHDCAQLEGGVTEVRHRAIVVNWTTNCIQVLDHRQYVWEDIFQILNEAVARTGPESVDVRKYDWHMSCEALPGAAPFMTQVTPIVNSPYTEEQAIAIIKGDMERWEKAQAAFSPTMTKEQVMERIGATAAATMAPPSTMGVAASTENALGGGDINPFADDVLDTPVAEEPSDMDALEELSKQAQARLRDGQL